jgi:membrane protease YdiL (CAAX protease family)
VNDSAPELEAEAETAPVSTDGRGGIAIALVVTAIVAGCMWFAFDPRRAGLNMLAVIGGTYAVLLVPTLLWLAREGTLRQQLTPARGDISIGALLAVLMYVVVVLLHRAIGTPGSIGGAWTMRLYLQIGDPRVTAAFYIGLGVMAVAAAEEIIWRGWVMRVLVKARGERAGWLLSTALYALAHAPTVYLLRDEIAGFNPMLVMAAGACGLAWGYLAVRIDRLGPSVFAHMLFSWAVIEFPILKW